MSCTDLFPAGGQGLTTPTRCPAPFLFDPDPGCGGHGTLSEIALALRIAAPVVSLNTWKGSIDDTRDIDYEFHVTARADEAAEKAIELGTARVLG